MADRNLIVLPDESVKPILDAIDAANKSLKPSAPTLPSRSRSRRGMPLHNERLVPRMESIG